MMGIGFPQFSSPLFFTLRTFGLALVRLSSVGFCFVIWGFEGGVVTRPLGPRFGCKARELYQWPSCLER